MCSHSFMLAGHPADIHDLGQAISAAARSGSLQRVLEVLQFTQAVHGGFISSHSVQQLSWWLGSLPEQGTALVEFALTKLHHARVLHPRNHADMHNQMRIQAARQGNIDILEGLACPPNLIAAEQRTRLLCAACLSGSLHAVLVLLHSRHQDWETLVNVIDTESGHTALTCACSGDNAPVLHVLLGAPAAEVGIGDEELLDAAAVCAQHGSLRCLAFLEAHPACSGSDEWAHLRSEAVAANEAGTRPCTACTPVRGLGGRAEQRRADTFMPLGLSPQCSGNNRRLCHAGRAAATAAAAAAGSAAQLPLDCQQQPRQQQPRLPPPEGMYTLAVTSMAARHCSFVRRVCWAGDEVGMQLAVGMLLRGAPTDTLPWGKKGLLSRVLLQDVVFGAGQAQMRRGRDTALCDAFGVQQGALAPHRRHMLRVLLGITGPAACPFSAVEGNETLVTLWKDARWLGSPIRHGRGGMVACRRRRQRAAVK